METNCRLSSEGKSLSSTVIRVRVFIEETERCLLKEFDKYQESAIEKLLKLSNSPCCCQILLLEKFYIILWKRNTTISWKLVVTDNIHYFDRESG